MNVTLESRVESREPSSYQWLSWLLLLKFQKGDVCFDYRMRWIFYSNASQYMSTFCNLKTLQPITNSNFSGKNVKQPSETKKTYLIRSFVYRKNLRDYYGFEFFKHYWIVVIFSHAYLFAQWFYDSCRYEIDISIHSYDKIAEYR